MEIMTTEEVERMEAGPESSGGFGGVMTTEEVERNSVSRPYDAEVMQASSKYGVDPNFIHKIINAESSYDPQAISPKGAMGLMQLMPGTARDLGVKNPFHPMQNIDAGTRYLKQQLDRFDNNQLAALVAYNAGPEFADQWMKGKRNLYPDTQQYISKVTGTDYGEVRPRTTWGEVGNQASAIAGSMPAIAAKKTWVGSGIAAAGGTSAQVIKDIIEAAIQEGSDFTPQRMIEVISENLPKYRRTALEQGLGEFVGRSIPGMFNAAFAPASKLTEGVEPEVKQAFQPYVQQAYQAQTGTTSKVPAFSLRQQVRSKAYNIMDEIGMKSFTSGNRLPEFYRAQRIGSDKYAQDMINGFWEQAGQKLSPMELRSLVSEVYEVGEDAFMKEAGKRYAMIDQLSQVGYSTAIVDLKPVRDWAEAEFQRTVSQGGLGSNYAQTFLKKLQDIYPQQSFMDAHDLRARLLSEGRNFEDRTVGKRMIMQAEQKVDEAMSKSAMNFDPSGDLYSAWREANKFYKEGKTTYRNQFITGLIDRLEKNPKEVVSAVFKPDNTVGLMQFKNMLFQHPQGIKAWEASKAAWLEDIFDKGTKAIQTSDVTAPRGTYIANLYNSYGPEFIEKVLTPGEKTSVERVMKALLVSQTRDPFMSPSGRSVFNTLEGKGLVNVVQGGLAIGGGAGVYFKQDPSWAILSGAALISPRVLSRMSTSPWLSKLLVDGLIGRIQPGTKAAAGLVGRLTAAAYDIQQQLDANKPFPDVPVAP